MPFSEKLAQIRKEKRLTQMEVAKQAGVGIAQIRRYEKGSSLPTLDAIKNLALTLGVTTDELIFDKPEHIAAAKIVDKELLEQFELISHMNQHDIEAIKTVLNGMILKSRLETIMPSRDKAWEEEIREVVAEFRASVADSSEEEIEEFINEAVTAVRHTEAEGRGQNLEA